MGNSVILKHIYILNIECSAYRSSVAICKNGALLHEISSDDNTVSSQLITLYVKDCFNKLNLDISILSAVAISSGPGSYTGLRVASSSAKGICYALNIPLISIDTLDIIAMEFSQSLSDYTHIIPMIDARRDEVYYKVMDDKGTEIEKTSFKVLDRQSFIHYSEDNVLVCGNGASKAKKLMTNSFEYYPSKACARHMGQLSYAKFEQNSFEDIAYYSPNYLKPPNITQSKKPLF